MPHRQSAKDEYTSSGLPIKQPREGGEPGSNLSDAARPAVRAKSSAPFRPSLLDWPGIGPGTFSSSPWSERQELRPNACRVGGPRAARQAGQAGRDKNFVRGTTCTTTSSRSRPRQNTSIQNEDVPQRITSHKIPAPIKPVEDAALPVPRKRRRRRRRSPPRSARSAASRRAHPTTATRLATRSPRHLTPLPTSSSLTVERTPSRSRSRRHTATGNTSDACRMRGSGENTRNRIEIAIPAQPTAMPPRTPMIRRRRSRERPDRVGNSVRNTSRVALTRPRSGPAQTWINDSSATPSMVCRPSPNSCGMRTIASPAGSVPARGVRMPRPTRRRRPDQRRA